MGSASCHEEEYYRRLSDHGAGQDTPEVRLTTDDPGPPVESWAGSIAVSGDVVHYAWMDLSGGDSWEVYYGRSEDLGLAWSLPGQQLTQHAPGCAAVRPTLAAHGDSVHLVWFEMCSPGGVDGHGLSSLVRRRRTHLVGSLGRNVGHRRLRHPTLGGRGRLHRARGLERSGGDLVRQLRRPLRRGLGGV